MIFSPSCFSPRVVVPIVPSSNVESGGTLSPSNKCIFHLCCTIFIAMIAIFIVVVFMAYTSEYNSTTSTVWEINLNQNNDLCYFANMTLLIQRPEEAFTMQQSLVVKDYKCRKCAFENCPQLNDHFKIYYYYNGEKYKVQFRKPHLNLWSILSIIFGIILLIFVSIIFCLFCF